MNPTTTLDQELLEAIIKDIAEKHGFSDDFRTVNTITDSVTDTLENQTKTEIIKAYLDNIEPNQPKAKPVPLSKEEYVKMANKVAELRDKES